MKAYLASAETVSVHSRFPPLSNKHTKHVLPKGKTLFITCFIVADICLDTVVKYLIHSVKKKYRKTDMAFHITSDMVNADCVHIR